MLHFFGQLLIYYVVYTSIFDETLMYDNQLCKSYRCLNRHELVPLPDQSVWFTHKLHKFLFALILYINSAYTL